MKKMRKIIAILLVLCLAPVLLFAEDTVGDDTSLKNAPVVTKTIQTELLPFDVFIVGYEESVDDVYDLVIQNTSFNKSADKTEKTLFVFTEGYSNYIGLEKTISDAVQNADLISFAFTDVDWNLITYPNSHPDESDIFALFVDDFGSSSFSRVGFERSYSIGELLSWACDPLISFGGSRDIPASVESTYYSNHDYNSSGYGTTSVRTVYIKYSETDTDYDYYSGHYFVSMQSNSSSYNSGLDVKSAMSYGTMMRYGPTATSGQTTVGVNTSLSVGLSGIDYVFGSSWSYSISDVIVMDYTLVVNNTLDIRHNVNEAANVGTGTYSVEPGKLIIVDDGDGYTSIDTYKTQFCKKDFFGNYSAYNDVSVNYYVSF